MEDLQNPKAGVMLYDLFKVFKKLYPDKAQLQLAD
jgi:hypothetical protein